MNIISKLIVTLTMATSFTASQASCLNAEGTVEGDDYIGATELLPVCEKPGKQAARSDDVSHQVVMPKNGGTLDGGMAADTRKASQQTVREGEL